MAYSPIVLDHFKNPRNVGEIISADGVGEVGNPVCGDMMNVYIKVENDRLVDVKFKTFGCGAAIAVSSMITEMARGKTLEEAMKITNADVAEALGACPPTSSTAPTWEPTPCTPPSRTTWTARPGRCPTPNWTRNPTTNRKAKAATAPTARNRWRKSRPCVSFAARISPMITTTDDPAREIRTLTWV